jgi:hypothetical protein
LVAEKIESEGTLVDLLDDYEVTLGQGYLFSPPRPVQADLLRQAVGDAPAPGTTVERPPPRETERAGPAPSRARRSQTRALRPCNVRPRSPTSRAPQRCAAQLSEVSDQ